MLRSDRIHSEYQRRLSQPYLLLYYFPELFEYVRGGRAPQPVHEFHRSFCGNNGEATSLCASPVRLGRPTRPIVSLSSHMLDRIFRGDLSFPGKDSLCFARPFAPAERVGSDCQNADSADNSFGSALINFDAPGSFIRLRKRPKMNNKKMKNEKAYPRYNARDLSERGRRNVGMQFLDAAESRAFGNPVQRDYFSAVASLWLALMLKFVRVRCSLTASIALCKSKTYEKVEKTLNNSRYSKWFCRNAQQDKLTKMLNEFSRALFTFRIEVSNHWFLLSAYIPHTW